MIYYLLSLYEGKTQFMQFVTKTSSVLDLSIMCKDKEIILKVKK
jgi:hypothetical protein